MSICPLLLTSPIVTVFEMCSTASADVSSSAKAAADGIAAAVTARATIKDNNFLIGIPFHFLL